jgi:anthranilate synthase component 1
MTSISLEQAFTRLENDVETPISHYIRHIGYRQGLLFESAEVDGRWGRFSIIAGNFLLCASCRQGRLSLDVRDARLESLKGFDGLPFTEGLRALMGAITITQSLPENVNPADLPPITRSLCGYFGYGMAGIFEPKLAACLPPAEAEACLALPGTVTLFDHVYNRVCRLSLLDEEPRIANANGSALAETRLGTIRASLKKESYIGVVRRIQERLRQGEGMQVVPSVGYEAPFEGDPFSLYRRLRRVNPSPYLFYMNLPGLTLMGSSPEVMVGCSGGVLRLCPIAGTRPRGETSREDNLFEEELVRDPKEQAEHVMLVDLARNDLGKVAEPGSVTLERYMEVERFSHVMHLTSYVSAKLRDGLDALDVLSATFPAGTVSGAPKIRAMQIIAEAEPGPRGPYGGAIGWLGLDKDAVHMDTGITIRSLWVRAGKVYWQSGGGIVLDSNPETEWKECANKAAAVAKALGVA